MKDCDIRKVLKDDLEARFSGNDETLIIEELGLRHGAARVDLAVVNGVLHGFEIKSDKDTLERLPHQVETYCSVLDRVTLVVGHRHFDEAAHIVPGWWGIQVASMGPGGGICISNAKEPGDNPCLSPVAVAKLLWRDEALALLEELGEAHGVRSKPRAIIYARLAEACIPDVIRARVRRQLRTRKGWRSGEGQK